MGTEPNGDNWPDGDNNRTEPNGDNWPNGDNCGGPMGTTVDRVVDRVVPMASRHGVRTVRT
jgi:hypothetical protein